MGIQPDQVDRLLRAAAVQLAEVNENRHDRERPVASPRAARLRELEDDPPEWLRTPSALPGRSKSSAGVMLAWRRAALAIEDYRTVSGHDSPTEAIGHVPSEPAARRAYVRAQRAIGGSATSASAARRDRALIREIGWRRLALDLGRRAAPREGGWPVFPAGTSRKFRRSRLGPSIAPAVRVVETAAHFAAAIRDQALNTVRACPIFAVSLYAVDSFDAGGHIGRPGRSGCCHGGFVAIRDQDRSIRQSPLEVEQLCSPRRTCAATPTSRRSQDWFLRRPTGPPSTQPSAGCSWCL